MVIVEGEIMFKNLQAYFNLNILESYKDYIPTKDSATTGKFVDLRQIVNLATVLYHFREHFPNDIKKTEKEISQFCPDYSLLGNIVNASKHKTLTKHNPQISRAENIYEVIFSTTYKDKKGEYQHIEKKVLAKLDDGTERDVFEIITNVLNMWLVELKRFEVIKHIEPFALNSNKIPRRTKHSGKLDFLPMRVGEMFYGQTFILQRYNYEKGVVEPINLTNASVKMNFYKPSYIISFNCKTKIGQELNFELTVDDDQKKQFNRLSKEEKIKFCLKLAEAQGKIKINWNNA